MLVSLNVTSEVPCLVRVSVEPLTEAFVTLLVARPIVPVPVIVPPVIPLLVATLVTPEEVTKPCPVTKSCI